MPKQCQPTSGTCACISSTAGQQMPCEVKNTAGTCVGVSVCNPLRGGFQECSARTPIPELCNGIDDDCDGRTDEDLADLRCGVGACERVVSSCANGRAQTCTPGQPTSELCNTVDDNCDGTVDEGFDTRTDVAHCGACGRVCALTNAVPKCEAGTCAIERCVAGWVNLDGVAANGCEHPCTVSNGGVEICDGADNDCDGTVDEGFNLLTDATNCGQCGRVCSLPNGNVSTYACVAGQCAVATCVMGRGDCNQQYADGCEVNLVSSLAHCGQCALACAPANATGTCQMGQCRVLQCAPGFRDCNGQPMDGCEVDERTDLSNCGACNNVCMAANATSTCMGAQCRFTCLANWYDADNNASTGCEYACIRTNNGVEACDRIDNDCDGRVDEDFDTLTDANHCGLCNRQCQAPNANTVCSQGVCGIGTCVAGRADCNTQYLDGCEVDTTTSPLHCGACGNTCSAPNVVSAQCVSSACRVGACAANRADCNGQFTDGCEVDTSSSLANCGGCGQACSLPFATAVCTASACAIGTCSMGRGNCNGVAGDGCEVNLASDVNHCGGCNQRCQAANATNSCVNQGCVYVCNAGAYDVDGLASNGCEYLCTPSGSDMPDLGLVDADCDGLDGTAAMSVFVDGVAGNDGNSGLTRGAPKRTITQGILAAQAAGRASVLLSLGTYGQRVDLASGISLYGGYDAANGWRRRTTNVTTIDSPATVGVLAQGLTAAVELQLLTIRSANAVGQEANGDGRSSLGVVVNGGTVALRGCSVQAGAATAGLSQSTAPDGAAGLDGAPGYDPSVVSGSSLAVFPAPRAAGGFSACGASGGAGGQNAQGTMQGGPGDDGATATSGAAASPGSTGGQGAGCDSSNGNGQPGLPVIPNPAANGAPGSNGAPGGAVGLFSGPMYLAAAGGDGTTGQHGGGGGGGGGGGATQRRVGGICTSSCSASNNTTSGGGGGGGGGGCGGAQGLGGRGGGASLGVVVLGGSLTLDATSVQTSTAGNGGSGGSGGRGGTRGQGGAGGLGQTRNNGGCADRRGGDGAAGGAGGEGGPGGGGAGGSGGPSVCVVHRGAVPNLTNWTCIAGAGGLAGPGGTGASQAPSGTPGLSQNTLQVP